MTPVVMAGSGYAGPSPRQRATIATGVIAGFLALTWGLSRIGGPVPPAAAAGTTLALFDVPPPPPPPPPAPTPRRVPLRVAPGRVPLAGGSPGHHRQTPMPVAHDPSPSLLDRPAAPVADIDAPPPASGLNLLAGSGTGGMDGSGTGTGSGSGTGDGAGSGSGGAPTRYTRAIWVVPPGVADFRREWPRTVPRIETAVHVFLACSVKSSGRPFACRTLIESRRGFGFASAAIRLAERSRVRPVFVDGRRTDIPVIIPISFLPAPGQTAAAVPSHP